MIKQLLHRTNKEITKLKYESEFYKQPEVEKMIDELQFHIFLVHTFFDKQEFGTSDVKERLLEKLENDS